MQLIIATLCVVCGMLGVSIGLYLLFKGFKLLFSKKVIAGLMFIGTGLPLSLVAAMLFLVPEMISGYYGTQLCFCRDNLHQIGRAVECYSQDHGGNRPTSFLQLTNYLERGCIIRHIVQSNGN